MSAMDVSGGDEVAQLLATMTQGDEHEGPKDHEAGRLAKSMRAFTHETQAMDLDEEMQGPKQEDEAPQQEDEGPKQEQLGPKQEDEGPKQDENVAALRSWKEDELVAFLRAWKEEWGKKHEDKRKEEWGTVSSMRQCSKHLTNVEKTFDGGRIPRP